MRTRARLSLPALAVASLLAVAGIASSHRRQPAASGPELTAHVRAAGLRFDPTVAEADREAVRAAIARARPEARTLIGLVDGLVDVGVRATGGHSVGLTQGDGSGYRVTLDLATVAARYGERGIERLVLHELGHVVDAVLVPDALMAVLDAGIPPGLGCEDGVTGACANRAEGFAETFAKWALGDIGVNLDIGYKVPPPRLPLDAWGKPLAQLATTALAG
jgi:hypothetical protein